MNIKYQLGCVSFAIIAWSAGGCTRGQENASMPLDFPVIDAHTHTEFQGGVDPVSGIPATQAEYLKEMKEAGVVGAIAHTTKDGLNYHDLRAYGVMHCGGVNATVDVKRIEDGLKSGQYGCIKIYLGYVRQWAYSLAYEPAYELAEKYDVPVVFHTGDTNSTTAMLKYADPLTVDEVAVEHPRITFVIAHCGNPWIESAAEVAYKNPNVYLDGSAFMVGDMAHYSQHDIDESIVKPVSWVFTYVDNPKKLMYGTDWPLVRMKPYLEAFKRAIPQQAWRDVFHDNAVRVFHLDRKLPVLAKTVVEKQPKHLGPAWLPTDMIQRLLNRARTFSVSSSR